MFHTHTLTLNRFVCSGGFIVAAACDFVSLARPAPGAKEAQVGLTEVKVGVPFPRGPLEVARHHLQNARSFREFIFTGK